MARRPAAAVLALALAALLCLASLSETRLRLRGAVQAAQGAWDAATAAAVQGVGETHREPENLADLDAESDGDADEGARGAYGEEDDGENAEEEDKSEDESEDGNEDDGDDASRFEDDRLAFPCKQDAECRETTFCDAQIGKCRPSVWQAERAGLKACNSCRNDVRALLGLLKNEIQFVADLVDTETGACLTRFTSNDKDASLEDTVARASATRGSVRRFHHHLESTLAHCRGPSESHAPSGPVNIAMHSGRVQMQLYTSPHFVVARQQAKVSWLATGFFDGFTADVCQYGPYDEPTACMVPTATAKPGAAFLLYVLNNWDQLPEWIAFFDAENGDRAIFEEKLRCLRVEPNMEIMEVVGFLPLDDTHQRARKPIVSVLRRELEAVWETVVAPHLGTAVPKKLPKGLAATRAFIVEGGHVTKLPKALLEELYFMALGLHAKISVSHPDVLPMLWSTLLTTSPNVQGTSDGVILKNKRKKEKIVVPAAAAYDCIDKDLVPLGQDGSS
ncbi:Hypothetical Protein FCC1311_084292 [Hondaea fermentalgiana]|uniref:Uncharacterized protein n=1 Tax=Hondaea fermentalgiana TaxID=2315210 RepID=A0A2R5GW87_9STRA|nr:Hypothetical Protein FCC1311_084292 [Hondaea fermentalgiana]|eukprot:GBG32204.1 Hypothetical Protein FCC1311_084292 [Hondaea fermentalgiana]